MAMRALLAFALLPVLVHGKALDLTVKNFKAAMEGKNAFLFFMAPWCGHCNKMDPDWTKLGKQYADTPNVVIGKIDCTQAEALCSEYGARGYPTIKYVKNGKTEDYNGGRSFSDLKRHVESTLEPRPACSLESKEACPARDLKVLEESEAMSKAERSAKIKEVEGDIAAKKKQAVELEKAAKELVGDLELIKLGGAKPEKVEQLLSDGDMRAHCEGRTCVIAFLPHILDDQAKGRNAHLKMLGEAMKASKEGPLSVGFMWTQGGDQFEMEEAMGLQFGFPAVIAVNFKKERFGVHRGTFDKDAIKQFLTSLTRGGTPLAPIPKSLKVVNQEAWDGKDGKPIEEEEL